MSLSQPIRVVAELATTFERLGIPYLVGGSLASSVYGLPRATQDVDLVADIRLSHVSGLVAALEGEFYLDAEMATDAVQRCSSFNVLHLATMFKADIFVAKADAWSRSELKRARPETIGEQTEQRTFRFASPEDVVLHKLTWYKLGNRVSERQWNDVLGILRIQGEALDDQYLDQWAVELGVLELLREAKEGA